jgi:redox-sensitive bicupin YhaK (pirin superfamily)
MIYKQIKSDERGRADYGWLQASYSFSFAHYYNPERTNFGVLRVLNDDWIAPGAGFGIHPHENMEIITIPLSGSLKHKDSMSNEWKPLYTGEVQIMSAGSGIKHSEMNNSSSESLNLFQIWIEPNKRDVEPRYDQKKFEKKERQSKLQVLVSGIDTPVEGSLTVHQDIIISRIDLNGEELYNYKLQSDGQGLYVMVIEGEVRIGENNLSKRDAIAIAKTEEVSIKAKSQSELLFLEVPFS